MIDDLEICVRWALATGGNFDLTTCIAREENMAQLYYALNVQHSGATKIVLSTPNHRFRVQNLLYPQSSYIITIP